jgi:hypothetical protein
MVKFNNGICAALVALILPVSLAAQVSTDLFKGGVGSGYLAGTKINSVCAPNSINPFGGGISLGPSNATKINSVCAPGSANPFGGGSDDGYTVGTKINSSCSMLSLNPFSGGTDDGYAYSVKINSACVPTTINAFSGGEAEGYSNNQLQNSECEPVSFNPFSGGLNDGYQSALKVNSDCYFQTATILTVPASACPGSTVVITGTGLFGVSSVSFNGTDAPDFSVNSSFSLNVRVPIGASSGTVSVNGSGGLATSPETITILTAPTVSISPVGPLSLCLGPAVLIASSDATTYSWSTGATTSSITANQPGSYSVVVTGSNGCKGYSDTVLVNEATFPIAGFTVNQTTGYTAQFSNTSIDATIYSWDFGNGNTSSQENPEFTFANFGTYPVTLIAINDCGSDTIGLDVVIVTTLVDELTGTEVLIAPNPFHDNLSVLVRMNTPENLHLSIYNMLGQLVFSNQIGGQKEQTILIDLSHLATGVYSVQLNNAYGNLSRKVVRD